MKRKFLIFVLCLFFSFLCCFLFNQKVIANNTTVVLPDKNFIIDFRGPVLVTKNFDDKGWRKHYGIDLRTYNFKIKRLCPVVAPEDMFFVRRGRDYFGNYFLVFRGAETGVDEIKFIHIYSKIRFRKNDIIPKGLILGYTDLYGSARGHHLHFETWENKKVFDPLLYFELVNIEYKFKRNPYDPIKKIIYSFNFRMHLYKNFIKNNQKIFVFFENAFLVKNKNIKYEKAIVLKRMLVYSRKYRYRKIYFICRAK